MPRIGHVLVALALACACGGHRAESPPARRAFYFWRTTFALSPAEQKAIDDLHIERVYVRLFDVGWNQGAEVMGPIQAGSPPPANVETVPVVFVENAVLQHASRELAPLIWRAVQARTAALGFAPPRELQLDCDWTDRTHDSYFALLRALETESRVPMSATIRLHQIKYRERTGVPPVARGMLMFYNMGKFSADPEARSIFDADSAEAYLARLPDYPLPLDVALPIWSWTVHVRDGLVIGLLQSTDPAELDTAPDLLVQRTPAGYRATRSTFFHGEWLREGDILKTEITGPDESLAAAELVAAHLPATSRTVTLFDLSERNLARHDASSLDRVFRAVR